MKAVDLDTLLAAIPYSAPLGLRARAEAGRPVQVRMAFTKAVTNYVGTGHAGALFTLAEAAAGIAAHRLVEDLGGIVLLKESTARFARRAESDLTAAASVAPNEEGPARVAFERERRAQASVEVAVTDAAGAAVFEGTFVYAFRPRQP